MAGEVVMPRLSDSMEEGTVLKWLVEVGGEVRRGEPLVEIETDKANMTYDADADGVLVEVLAKEGDTLPVGAPIARIGEAGEAPSGNGASASEPEPPAAAPEREDAPEPAAAPAPTAAPAPAAAAEGRLKASPVARRVAGELGVDLGGVTGSGPGGRIVKADVESAAAGGAPAAAPEEARRDPSPAAPEKRGDAAPVPSGEGGAKGDVAVHELTRLQRTVTRRMAESKATAPDFVLEVQVDMTAAVEMRERLKRVSDPAPSYNDMVVKASAAALREHPRVNGAYRDGRFEHYSRVNVGVAVAADDALVVPTVFDADRKSLGQIAEDTRVAAERVRAGEITPPEVAGGTFTVSNLGMFGIDSFTAIINPPQAALLTVGSLRKRPVVDDHGRVVARDTMNLTLVCDHRILYGADGARFLAKLRELLEYPLSMAL